jgi:glycerol kinase
MLPEVRSSAKHGDVSTRSASSVPIAGIAGDQQAALFGQMCRQPGMSRTLGWLLPAPNIGHADAIETARDDGGVADRRAHDTLEGSVFMAARSCSGFATASA